MTAPEAAPAVAELRDSPAWYPLEAGRDGVHLLRLAAADYAAASFLDQRLLQGAYPRARAAPALLAAAAAGPRRPAGTTCSTSATSARRCCRA